MNASAKKRSTKKFSNRRRYYDVRQYAMLFNAENEILVLQLPLHYQPYGGQWTFPGGKLEPSDVPEEGILREIEEETCLQAEVEEILHLDRWDTERSRKLAIFYRCRLVGRRKQPVLSEEHRSAKWISIDDSQELEFYSAYFRRALEKSADSL
ncbi:MAG: NUDIX hydrolase [Alphaproteobacteria bacterium]|nr:NUDIX hydrolase [Alphaproteobacteria bacterium]MDD9920636.1 NUDIX hydrolase [Alphaproteobacteria bacterium]